LKVVDLANKLNIVTDQLVFDLKTKGIPIEGYMCHISDTQILEYLTIKKISVPACLNYLNKEKPREAKVKHVGFYCDGVRNVDRLLKYINNKGHELKEYSLENDAEVSCDILISSSLSALTEKEREVLKNNDVSVVIFANTDFDAVEDLIEDLDESVYEKSFFVPEFDVLLNEEGGLQLEGYNTFEKLLFGKGLTFLVNQVKGLLNEKMLKEENIENLKNIMHKILGDNVEGRYTPMEDTFLIQTVDVTYDEEENIVPTLARWEPEPWGNMTQREQEIASQALQDGVNCMNTIFKVQAKKFKT